MYEWRDEVQSAGSTVQLIFQKLLSSIGQRYRLENRRTDKAYVVLIRPVSV
jgi:hypothetical protein